MENEKREKTIDKIDKVTKIFTIVVCCILGTIFIASCVYMLQVINKEQEKQPIDNSNKTSEVQNMNLVNM